jgi:LuxR family maltose regulon positive regulatory protein
MIVADAQRKVGDPMNPSLLATKVRIPPLPAQTLQRPRLHDTLESGVPKHKLTLVAAPAGYGKTTLLAQWARATGYAVAWLGLDEADGEVARFFRYLLAAWASVQPDVMDSPLATLLSGLAPETDAVKKAFINAAVALDAAGIFVLDDIHLVDAPAIYDALTFLLDHLPPSLHFVLAARAEPPLPLARYRARGQLLEIDEQQLRFRPEETRAFLQQRTGQDVAADVLESLQAQVEGWAAGLHLAALSWQQGEGVDTVVSGRHRFVADYLREDVLAQLPAETRRFLLQTSIVDQLSGSLCNAITGREDGQAMLEALARQHLFVIPLDDNREWFRYHRLFRDFLRAARQQRTGDNDTELHRRAANWYFAQEMPDEAFPHAVAGDDAALVIQIFERYVQTKLLGGEFRLLRAWLDMLPAGWYATYPQLSLVETGLLLFTGQIEASTQHAAEVERLVAAVEGVDTRAELARVSAVRCSIACFQDDLARAEAFATEALQDLPPEDHFFRAIIYGSLGDTYRRHGQWREARTCYVELEAFAALPGFRLQAVHVFGALADLDLRQGKLRDADDHWQQAMAAIAERENWGRLPLPLVGWVHIRRGELLYEWDERDEAWEHVTQGLERAELGGDVRAMIAGYLLAARLNLTEGDVAAADDYLEQARPLVQRAHFHHWAGRFERLQLELWLAQDKLRAAVNWADTKREADGSVAEEGAAARLALARVLIVKGDGHSLSEALDRLPPLLRAAEEEGRMGVCVEALALQALARHRRGDVAGALTALTDALHRAEPQGYVRTFADLGPAMALLLQEARSRDVMPTYVTALLEAFTTDLPLARGVQAPVEPLTERELDVLALMAAGLTNREIGEELVIAPGTVKKHAANIYGKLNVGNRTEAAAKARDLGLLD